MRRPVATLLGMCALSLPYVGAASGATGATRARVVTKVATKTLAGDPYEASRWGSVQVTLTVRRTTTTTRTTKNGKTRSTTKVKNMITGMRISYSVHTDRSQYIMEQALPMLKQEVLTANSVDVQMISRATDTSEAFLGSLQSAMSHLS